MLKQTNSLTVPYHVYFKQGCDINISTNPAPPPPFTRQIETTTLTFVHFKGTFQETAVDCFKLCVLQKLGR